MKIIAAIMSLVLSVSCASVAKPKISEVTLVPQNSVFFRQPVTNASVHELLLQLVLIRNVTPIDQDVYIVLYSGGGQVPAAAVFMHEVKQIPNVKIICLYCASAAGAMFVGSGQENYAVKASVMLMHEMTLTTTVNNLKKLNIPDEDAYENEFNRIMYERMGVSREVYQERILDKEWIVRGDNLVKQKLADKFVKVTCNDVLKQIYPQLCKIAEGKTDELEEE